MKASRLQQLSGARKSLRGVTETINASAGGSSHKAGDAAADAAFIRDAVAAAKKEEIAKGQTSRSLLEDSKCSAYVSDSGRIVHSVVPLFQIL